MVIRTKVVIGWFKLQFWMCLVDAHYNFECDRLIQLSDNNLASEWVENNSFFKLITIEKIVIFMISVVIA